jgi:hypothetical protein
MAKKKKAEEIELIDHVVTQEDLDINPELVLQGVEVGETIQMPVAAEEEEEEEVVEEVEEVKVPVNKNPENLPEWMIA